MTTGGHWYGVERACERIRATANQPCAFKYIAKRNDSFRPEVLRAALDAMLVSGEMIDVGGEMYRVAEPAELVSIRRKAERTIVNVLDDFMERAKDGEFNQIAVVATTHAGDSKQGFGGGGPLLQMVGALDVTKCWLMRHLEEQQ